MANWNNINSEGTVDDRRGSPAMVGGGLGLTGLIIYFVFSLLSGNSPSGALVNSLENIAVQPQANVSQQEFDGKDSYEAFVSKVLGSNNTMWSTIFTRAGKDYTEPKLVLFRSATESGCGVASSDVGPHYCPADQTIYLDETFFNDLSARFGAQGGDVAEAYVISHEVGHHAQNLLGIMDQLDTSQNADSVRLELQADCFAGLWANSLKNQNVFEPGEIHEAIDAAAAVGDDRIQKTTSGRVSPELWTHGSSAQRVNAFDAGYEKGTLAACQA